jgi:demethylmenaquinone methyltransferase/2-methoxy-6-polyprenyl-1,4-benzoquinol methylase
MLKDMRDIRPPAEKEGFLEDGPSSAKGVLPWKEPLDGALYRDRAGAKASDGAGPSPGGPGAALAPDHSLTQGSKKIRRMFDKITPRYDLLNRVLSFGRDLFWRRALSHRLVLLSYPGSFLDLATGSGDQLLAIRDFWPYALLTGLDFSANMLDLAQKKIEKLLPHEEEISLVLGDAYNAPFAPESFDSISVSFGLRNLPDRPKVYKEVLRLLKPGGRFLVLELFFDKRSLLSPFHQFHLKRVTPFVASLFFKEEKRAYDYLAASVLDFPHPSVILTEMEGAGFKVLDYETFTFGSSMLVWGQKPISARKT